MLGLPAPYRTPRQYCLTLTELLAGKMARSNYTGIIKEALNKDLAWNWGNIDLNLSNYNNKDSKGEYKDSKDLNMPHGIVK